MKFKTILLVCGMLAVALVVFRLHSMWHFRSIDPVIPGDCTVVSGLVGVEDIVVDPHSGLAYLSVCDRRAVAAGQPANGGIWTYDLNDDEPVPLRLDGGPVDDFQPHGIDLLSGPSGAVSLFVVNHGQGRHAVERFDMNGRQLVHRETVQDPLIVSPNDVTAVAGDRFYVTNDHGSRGAFGKILEDYLGLKRSGVVYYDGTRCRNVAGGIGYANGIALGPDGSSVVVCACSEGTVREYGRDAGSGALVLRQTIACGTAVDNVDVDASGALWIGAHPKPLKFARHARSARHRSPSEVIRLTPRPDGTFERQTIYLDDGTQLSGCSVAVAFRNRLLVGSVFEPFFLDWRLNPSVVETVSRRAHDDG